LLPVEFDPTGTGSKPMTGNLVTLNRRGNAARLLGWLSTDCAGKAGARTEAQKNRCAFQTAACPMQRFMTASMARGSAARATFWC
jgi:hypothetical protein